MIVLVLPMKLLTKHTDYAVRALCYLSAQRNCLVSSRKIAEHERIPLQFMRRILRVLKKARIIETKEGISGGVCLKKPAEKIYLTGLMELFQGQLRFAECMFRKKICTNRSTCSLRRKIKKIEALVVNEFRQVTIADLARQGG